MRIIFVFILCIFVFSCDKSCPPVAYEISEKEKLADAIMAKVAMKLRKEFSLIPCGTGGGMMYQIRMLALSFDYRKRIDIQEGRELIVAAVNEFISEVNADERIRPYLDNYPFESKNVEIRIFFSNPNRSEVPLGQLSAISITRGIVDYCSFDSKKMRMETIYKESFEEAVTKIMQQESQSA